MQQIETPFIHFHIPKTAGTSLRAVLIDEFGPQSVSFMMPNRQFVRASELPFETEELDKKRRAARAMGQLNAFSEEIRAVNRQREYSFFGLDDLSHQGIRVATGHLMPVDITDTVAHLSRTTVVQDPLIRALSHYEHWREASGTMWWHDGTVPYADDVSFEAFASDPMITNYQTRQLGSLTFRAMGVVDKLTEFLEEIGLDPGLTVPHLNPNANNETPSMDKAFVKEFIDMNSKDYELYTAAGQRFGV
ncbi:MAG: hypothetical protein WA843_02100 [Candidatus Saccharimonadales bacterium]